MTKSEFLEKLRAALGNDLTGSIIQENINYYSQYISDEVNKGRSESEVIEELGDPWVLAQTIIDTSAPVKNSTEDYQYGTDDASYEGYSNEQRRDVFHTSVFSGWKLVLLAIGMIGVLFLVMTVIGGILSFFAPILIPVLVILFVIRIFRNR